MKGFYFIVSSSILLLFASCAPKNEGWTSLLDKELSQWRIYQSYAFPETFNGQRPVDEEGQTITPIGYDKNEQNVFSVIEEDGEPVLHITGETYGCVFTKQDYKHWTPVFCIIRKARQAWTIGTHGCAALNSK